jgi:hypothetical protein
MLTRKRLARVKLPNLDRLLLLWRHRFFPSIQNAIAVVKPETVIPGTAAASEPTGAGALVGAAADDRSIADPAYELRNPL